MSKKLNSQIFELFNQPLSLKREKEKKRSVIKNEGIREEELKKYDLKLNAS